MPDYDQHEINKTIRNSLELNNKMHQEVDIHLKYLEKRIIALENLLITVSDYITEKLVKVKE
tara:strand:- start:362 stop:547 length:186 start_codon:yes stop_codon:yes gene_type:complete